jgi:hypothetical protein
LARALAANELKVVVDISVWQKNRAYPFDFNGRDNSALVGKMFVMFAIALCKCALCGSVIYRYA